MIPLLRKENIKKILLEEKSVIVVELAQRFEVSEETIRRDLKILEEEGVAIKDHGGAILAESVMSKVTTGELKQIFLESKKIISNFVAGNINARDCIFIDSSTTSYFIAKALSDIPLRVVTNSLETMKLLSNNAKHELIGIGGELSKNRKCFVGSHAQKMVSDYFFDYAFISCRTLSLNEGATDSSVEEAEIKRIAAKQSKQTWLAADHSKFNKLSFSKILPIAAFDYIVTDKPMTQDWIKYLEDKGIKYFDNADGIKKV